jgi:hypothetical protein
LRAQVETFLAGCRQPALLEPGETPLPLRPEHYALTARASGLLLEAWDDVRTLARRITASHEQRPSRLTLVVEKFGGRAGFITLLDLDRPQAAATLQRSTREVLREHLRRWLARQCAGWRIVELTTGPDLQHTLSPSCPRAFVVKGDSRWAALAAPPQHADTALTNGLIWLDYLRRREAPTPVQGLILFLPCGQETNTLLRLRHLHVKTRLFRYDDSGFEAPIDPDDHGNLFTRLEPWQESLPAEAEQNLRRLTLEPEVELIPLGPGLRSLRVRGLEFARYTAGALLPDKPIEDLAADARRIAKFRHPDSPVPHHPLLTRNPEAWLESILRRNVTLLDAALLPSPVYGQVPALAGVDRGVLDLLAIEHTGRLAVIEIKASEDPHLPLQALDYWIRVAHHAALGEFTANGYFPGLPVLARLPRLLLAAPAMNFHPTTEILLSFFHSHIPVERIGLGVEWQRHPKVVLRARGADRPDWDPADF